MEVYNKRGEKGTGDERKVEKSREVESVSRDEL